uniref:Replication factor A protein 3 n=1 Tax=Glossina brevipalpis TaxID=37001 RepID=A0A1A9WXV0_9MUSC
MDTFMERAWVNGGLMKNFIGQNVSVLLCVNEEIGPNLITTSTDDQSITVKVSEVVGAKEGEWIEVHGKPLNSNTIHCKEIMSFGGEDVDLDKESYDMLVNYMNNCREIYTRG